MQRVKVELGDRSYEILIGRELLSQLGPRCRKLNLGSRCAVITDSNVAAHYGKETLRSLEASGFQATLITIPAGEKSKSLKYVGECYDAMAEHRLERKSFVVALGGGVVGDLAGFVASSYLRGIPFVQVPTTLLAQVDSSVGGKTGINLKAGKNLVGAFYQPKLVLCDLATLDTLPARELCSGLAEVIKYGIIYDAAFFRRLEQQIEAALNRDPPVLAKIIARCCAIKAEVVSQDETETGLRAILNFGHTIGHAIEAISGYGKYLHGEAISIGQVCAARLSEKILGLPAADVERIRALLERAGLPTEVRFNAAQKQKLLAAMKLDKKVSLGEIKFVLARQIGKVEIGQRATERDVLSVIPGV
jgi:3-dehydroquinate synthase